MTDIYSKMSDADIEEEVPGGAMVAAAKEVLHLAEPRLGQEAMQREESKLDLLSSVSGALQLPAGCLACRLHNMRCCVLGFAVLVLKVLEVLVLREA